MAIDTELVIRFFAALEAGDIDTLREIYAPDAVIWHNDDLIEQPVEDNLKVLQGLHRAVSGLRYDIVRRVPAADGVLQQHILRGQLAREPPPPYEGEGPFALWHFSEDPSLDRFRPHIPATNPAAQPLVWAVDTRHAPMFWFPRDCPRGCIWPVPATTPEDRERFFGQSAANRPGSAISGDAGHGVERATSDHAPS